MNVSEICSNIKEKDIVLYGDQEEIEVFLEKYFQLLKIHIVITDHKDEVRLQSYKKWDIKTVLFKEVVLSENQLIVICSEEKFSALKRRLDYAGKKEYKEYISHELIESLLYGKKLMVCMGTQLLGQVYLFLKTHKQLLEEYSVLFYPESHVLEIYKNRLQEYMHVCRCCTIYVRSACEKERFQRKVLGSSVLNKECMTITVADYGFGGYYPQVINNRDAVSNYLLREHNRLPLSYETLAFSRMDKEILELCERNVSSDNIVELLMDDNFYPEQKIRQYFDDEINRFEYQENLADIKLSKFINEHKEKYLCRNLNEWNEPAITYISNLILEILNLAPLSVSLEKRITLIEENSGSEMPVYPSVQNALGVEEILKNKKYKVTTYYKTQYMTLDEYLHFIAEYLYKAMDIMLFTGMDGERLFIQE
jgi:hypothetical protein